MAPVELLPRAKEAVSVETLALSVDANFAALNPVLAKLGPPYKAIDRTSAHEIALAAFLTRQSALIRESLRARYRPTWVEYGDLAPYRAALAAAPMNEIGPDEVLAVLKPIWTTKTETASRLRGRIEQVLAWATVKHHRKRENPARWKGNLEFLLPKASKVKTVEHHEALPYQDLPAFMADLTGRESVSALALQWLILTGVRSTEGREAQWQEVDTDAGVWTVPASRMKMKVAHRVGTLVGAGVELADAMALVGWGKDDGGYHFFLDRMACAGDVAGLLSKLLTVNGHLPTGSSASPILSFFAYEDMFEDLNLLAVNAGCVMTVYVDDIVFSGPGAGRSMIYAAKRIIANRHLRGHKTKVFRAGHPFRTAKDAPHGCCACRGRSCLSAGI